MRTFLCEIDHTGLRRFFPQDLLPADELRRLERGLGRGPASLFWSLLNEDDAEDLRADVEAGRHAAACGLLLNRAVELIMIRAALGSARELY